MAGLPDAEIPTALGSTAVLPTKEAKRETESAPRRDTERVFQRCGRSRSRLTISCRGPTPGRYQPLDIDSAFLFLKFFTNVLGIANKTSFRVSVFSSRSESDHGNDTLPNGKIPTAFER